MQSCEPKCLGHSGGLRNYVPGGFYERRFRGMPDEERQVLRGEVHTAAKEATSLLDSR
jgi:hypothetical protein